jgi:hypothetical protein
MKNTSIVILFFVLIVTSVYGSFISPPYDNTKPPAMSLPIAYDYALTALGSQTNEFHCVSANITTIFTTEGEWYFSFCSTNSKISPKLIAVEFNGKVIFDNGLR